MDPGRSALASILLRRITPKIRADRKIIFMIWPPLGGLDYKQ